MDYEQEITTLKGEVHNLKVAFCKLHALFAEVPALAEIFEPVALQGAECEYVAVPQGEPMGEPGEESPAEEAPAGEPVTDGEQPAGEEPAAEEPAA